MIILKINRQMLRQTLRWMYWLIVNGVGLMIGRKNRFIVLTPPIFGQQLIFDIANKKIISVAIRDIVDYLVIGEVFASEDYSIERISRAKELFANYQRIVNGGKRPLIIDCGGNSGMATKYFCNTYNEAVIICVEPDAENILMAKLNNKNCNVYFMQAGVGNSDVTGNIIDPGRGSWGYQIEENCNGSTKIISINSLLKKTDFADCVPFLIKIDIEGFECNLFEKNTEWIDSFEILIIELHDWMLPKQGNSQKFLREMSKRDRDFIIKGGNIFSISNSTV